MAYRTAIVEDDLLSLQILQDMLEDEFDDVEIVGVFTNIKESLTGIPKADIDLIFLDMELSDGKGFDLLTSLESIDFEVIITTMHDSYMLEAIKHSAIDYVMKPVTKPALRDAMKRFKARIEKLNKGKVSPTNHIDKLVIPNQEGLQLIEIQNILKLESDGAYTLLYLLNGEKLITSKNLGYYQDQLIHQGFFRVHHSHLINLNHIKNYVRGDGGHVVLSDNSIVNVSRRKKEEFLAILGA